MNIAKDHAVKFEYTLKDDEGAVIDSSDGKTPLAYLHGHQNIVPGLEKELEGKQVGDQFVVTILAADGYGARRDEIVTKVTRQELAGIEGLQVGIQLQAETPQGMHVFTVVAIEEQHVTLDGNHPLAGQDLHFDVKVIDIRDATSEEIAHGHVHGEGGHQH